MHEELLEILISYFKLLGFEVICYAKILSRAESY